MIQLEDKTLDIQQNIQIQLQPKRFSEIYLEKGSFFVKPNQEGTNRKQQQQRSILDSYFKSLSTDLFGLSFVFLEQQDIQGKEMQDLSFKLEFYTIRCYFEYLQNIQIDIMPGNFPNQSNLKFLLRTMNLLKRVNNKILWVRQDKIVTLDECVELAQIFFEQKNLKQALFYFSKMLSIEIYNGQLYIDIRESMYISSDNLIKVLQVVTQAFPSFYDIHIRIGDNNQLNSNVVDPFSDFIKYYAQSLKVLKIFIGNRNYLGSKLFSKLGQVVMPFLKSFKMEILSNNDQLSTDSQGLFDFLSKQTKLKQLSLSYGSKNSLNAKTFENFGRSLQNLRDLTELEVNIGQWNKIQSEGCNNFTESIQNLNLQKIELVFEGLNGITPEGASKFFEILSKFNRLLSIKVGFGDKNCLDQKCIRSFSNCIKQQIDLSTLTLNLIHKIDYDTSAIFQAIENKHSLSNLYLKIGQEYNIAGQAIEQLCQSLISLEQLRNLNIEFLGTKNLPMNQLELLCMAIRKIPSLIGFQFYTDELPDDKAMIIFRNLFEGNINFKDIRIGYNILFQYNYSKFELEIKGNKKWDRETVMSICRQISKYQPINNYIIKFNSEKTKHCQPSDLVTMLRYACMSFQKNPFKDAKILILFEGFLEIYTQSFLLESYNQYDFQNQFLLNNKETSKFFKDESKIIHINYIPHRNQNLSALQLEDVIQLVSGLGYDCINLKQSLVRRKNVQPNQQQALQQMMGMQQQAQNNQQDDEQSEDSDEDQDQQNQQQQQQQHQQQQMGNQNNQIDFNQMQYVQLLTCTINQLKNSKIKKFTVESLGYFYMRLSDSKFNFYLFERQKLPQHTLRQLSMNLIQRTTNLQELEFDLRGINNQGIQALRHLIDNQPKLIKLYLQGSIKLLIENIEQMSHFHLQLRQQENLISLHLPIEYVGLEENEIPDFSESQIIEFTNFMTQNHNDMILRIQQIQDPLTEEEGQELQRLQQEITNLREQKKQEYFKRSVEQFKIVIANTQKQVTERQALAYMMKLLKIKLNRKIKKDIIIDIGRSLYTQSQ